MDTCADLSSDCGNCGMEIGDLVTYNGKSYVLRGLEPMSVPDRRAEIEDAESGELLSVPFALLAVASAAPEV